MQSKSDCARAIPPGLYFALKEFSREKGSASVNTEQRRLRVKKRMKRCGAGALAAGAAPAGASECSKEEALGFVFKSAKLAILNNDSDFCLLQCTLLR